MKRTIRTCAGIGDSIFLINKLVNAKERFNILLPDNKPQRGHQIWELLPNVTESVSYIGGMNYKTIEQFSQHRKPWSQITQPEFYLSANRFLENGNRIEDFLSELPMSKHINWDIKQYATQAKNDYPLRKGIKYIGIYASAYSTARNWGFWGATEWAELIMMIHKERPKWKFVIIGAEWDNDIANDLVEILKKEEVAFDTVMSKPLGYVANVMKQLDYGFYFPSGLPIFSETIKGASDLTMFFPHHLKQMMGSFSDLSRKQSGRLKECLFCSPTEIFKWWRDVYVAFERIEQTKGVL